VSSLRRRDRVAHSACPGRALTRSRRSTLLNALAGQLPRAPGMRLTGSVRVNGGAAGGGASQGFVGQDDEFFAQDSVEETLNLAAQLRLPRRTPAARKRALVEALIAQLGLARVAQSKVGGAKTRGISGGERKRLAIACEMLASPSLLFLGACNARERAAHALTLAYAQMSRRLAWTRFRRCL